MVICIIASGCGECEVNMVRQSSSHSTGDKCRTGQSRNRTIWHLVHVSVWELPYSLTIITKTSLELDKEGFQFNAIFYLSLFREQSFYEVIQDALSLFSQELLDIINLMSGGVINVSRAEFERLLTSSRSLKLFQCLFYLSD